VPTIREFHRFPHRGRVMQSSIRKIESRAHKPYCLGRQRVNDNAKNLSEGGE
jgi:hypothetical protein